MPPKKQSNRPKPRAPALAPGAPAGTAHTWFKGQRQHQATASPIPVHEQLITAADGLQQTKPEMEMYAQMLRGGMVLHALLLLDGRWGRRCCTGGIATTETGQDLKGHAL